MIPLKLFPIFGYIYAGIAATVLSYLGVVLIEDVVHGHDIAIAGLVVVFIWCVMTGVLMIAIRERKLTLAKVYRTFHCVGTVLTLLGGLICYHIQAAEDLTDKRIVWSLTSIVVGVVFIISIPIVWIVNGVVRFIRDENSA